jgi:hypothetical protein
MLETAAQIAALGVVVWVFNYQLPKARREQDTFAVICSFLPSSHSRSCSSGVSSCTLGDECRRSVFRPGTKRA